MSTAMAPTGTAQSMMTVGRVTRLLAILVIVAGAVMTIAGITTWVMVRNQLADEKITVAEDSSRYAGERVDGPLTAYQQAETIEKHALKASGGKTYAELPRDDPRRDTVMTGSFLRASLFTSVVSFGVAAMATGLGIVIILIGLALMALARRMSGIPAGTMGSAAMGDAGGPMPAM